MAPSTETVEHVSFKVEGAFLAELAVQRLFEGAANRALTLLTDSLVGLSHEDAIRILEGRATLTGDSNTGIELSDLPEGNPTQMGIQERMEEMYGHLLQVGDVLWEPYAYVQGLCREDYDWTCSTSRPFSDIGTKEGETRARGLRPLYYADNRETDLLVQIPQQLVHGNPVAHVLCRRYTQQVPFWIKICRGDMIKHCSNVLSNRGLERRGATFEGDDAPDAGIPIKKIPSKEELVKLGAVEAIKVAEETMERGDLTTSDLSSVSTAFERVITLTANSISNSDWDRVEAIRKKIDEMMDLIIREQVNEQAEKCGGFLELPLENNTFNSQKFLRVPKNPFLKWCLRNVDVQRHGHEPIEWTPVSKSGMKMYGDDPYHTDWMMGANVPLNETYAREGFAHVVRLSSYTYRDTIIKQYTGHQFTTLAKGKVKHLIGSVVKPGPDETVPAGSIAIVPHAGPEYQAAMLSASAKGEGGPGLLICETGGKLAHLAVVGREHQCTVLMLPGALSMYRYGDQLQIDVEEGTIQNFI